MRINNLAEEVFGPDFHTWEIGEEGFDSVLASLPKKEEDVLRYRYFDKLTYKAIGAKYGVGGERIRQIAARALRRMRKYFIEHNNG